MPPLDHFHPPLSSERRWESFHSNWATKIADALTERWLPLGYIVEEHVHFGPSVEIDVAHAQFQGALAVVARMALVGTVTPREMRNGAGISSPMSVY